MNGNIHAQTECNTWNVSEEHNVNDVRLLQSQREHDKGIEYTGQMTGHVY